MRIVVAGQQQQTAAAANGWRAGKLALAFADADGTGAGVAFGKAPCRARRPARAIAASGTGTHITPPATAFRHGVAVACPVEAGEPNRSGTTPAIDRPPTATDLTAS
jgi:hypothetical protein